MTVTTVIAGQTGATYYKNNRRTTYNNGLVDSDRFNRNVGVSHNTAFFSYNRHTFCLSPSGTVNYRLHTPPPQRWAWHFRFDYSLIQESAWVEAHFPYPDPPQGRLRTRVHRGAQKDPPNVFFPFVLFFTNKKHI